jgi:hypothetical protein
MAAAQPPWEECSHDDDCIGARLPDADWCLDHAAEQAPGAFVAELKRIRAGGTVDARGVVFSAELLARLRGATPRTDGRPTFTDARFDQASFQDAAIFGGPASRARPGSPGARFRREVHFDQAAWHPLRGSDLPARRLVRGDQVCAGTTAGSAPGLRRVSAGCCSLRAADPDRGQYARTQLPADPLSSRGPAPAPRRPGRLGRRRPTGPSLLVGVPALSDPRLARREQRFAQAMRQLAPQATVHLSARPRMLSVQGANLAGLGLANVDLAECRFAGSHNLDQLRLETNITFSAAPVCCRLGRSPGCTGLYARAVKMPRMSLARPTSTTARWRCAATPATATRMSSWTDESAKRPGDG